MRVKIFFEKEKTTRTVDASEGQTIESILKRLGINPQTVIVFRNGEVVAEQETLKGKDGLRIMRFK